MADSSPTLPDPQHTAALVGYLQQALAALDAGEPVDPAQLCADRPELAGAVAEALGIGAVLPRMQQAARDRDPLQGVVLDDRYELRTRIGSGAMGVVYDGFDHQLRRTVAVKILDARLFHRPDAEARFEREAQSLARFQHGHVVRVHDRGRSDAGIHYLVMERLQGASLAAVLARLEELGAPAMRDTAWLAERLGAGAAPPEPTALRLFARWGAEIAEALAAAHAEGVRHRDVKPSNVFVTTEWRAVLLDFGIAAQAGDAALTATHTTLGTPWYMAPEQARGAGDARADVYGLAASLYHLLAQRPPYVGEPAEVLVRLQHEDPPPLRRLRPEIAPDLAAIVETGMAHAAADRYRDAATMAADLRAFLRHEPISARPLSPLGRLWRRTRRAPARTLAWTGGVAVVALLAVGLPLWRSSLAQRQAAEKAELLARLPSLLALEGEPDERLLVDLSEDAESLAVLDRLLELDPDDDAVRLIRAAVRLDLGRHDAAAADVARLAAQTESPYLSAVAARFAAANRAQRGTLAVDLDGIEAAPQQPVDHFVAGFHALRNRHQAGYAVRADEHLAAARELLPARDLRLIALVARGEAEQKLAFFEEAYAETLELKGIYGRDTARTAAIRGVCLIVMKRYADAIEPLELANSLRPGRHQPLTNLGIAYRRTDQLDAAQRCLEEAMRLRPHFWNTKHTLAQLLADRGEFDRAFALAESLPTEGSRGVAWKRLELMGKIRFRMAGLALAGDPERSRTLAAEAAELWRQAKAAADDDASREMLAQQLLVAEALRDNDPVAATKAMLGTGSALQDPYDLANLATALPAAGLDAEAGLLLRINLRRLAIRTARGDQRFVEVQKDQLRREVGELEELLAGR